MDKMITNDIVYIGVDDTDLDLFESQYIIPNGISYNSYLIKDEKIAIMDTADNRKMDEWLTNLRTALEGRTPDYLVGILVFQKTAHELGNDVLTIRTTRVVIWFLW